MSVRQIQQWLSSHGFNPGPIDGIMGPKTRAAIRAFQQAAGITVDGIVGPQTTGAMSTYGQSPPPPSPTPAPDEEIELPDKEDDKSIVE